MGLKAKLAMALATSAAGAALVAGGSFALFTSSATNSGNTFTAGTVVLTDTTPGGSIASQAVNFNNLAPGDNGTVSMTVTNSGTLDEWVKIDGTATSASESGALFTGANGVTLTPVTDVVMLAPGASHTFNIAYNFPLAADNTYQGASGSFNVVADAVQARNNTNSTNDGPNAWN